MHGSRVQKIKTAERDRDPTGQHTSSANQKSEYFKKIETCQHEFINKFYRKNTVSYPSNA
jgi:hypothetical protein